jgi:subtilisin family serine protease
MAKSPRKPKGQGRKERDSKSQKSRSENHDDRMRECLVRQTAPQALDSKENRARWKLDQLPFGRGPYLVELNVAHSGGLPAADRTFVDLFKTICGELSSKDKIDPPPDPLRVSRTYYRCEMRPKEWRQLIEADEKQARTQGGDDELRHRSIYRLWPDFPIKGHISQSLSTVKADAALRSYDATGEDIVWAVIDSGIDASHRHFNDPKDANPLLNKSVKNLHRCFAPVNRRRGGLNIPEYLASPDMPPDKADRDVLVSEHIRWALKDDYGHGTHVAGIIAGRAPTRTDNIIVLEREDHINAQQVDNDATKREKVTRARRATTREAERLHGVAPGCRLISLRVLDENGEGRTSDVIRALGYIHEQLNDNPKLLRVHGVNLSVGYEFDAEMFACGQSPLCSEVNRLVLAGVVVVASAGNTGYGTVNAETRATKVGLSNTINDPGNAELAITVGATHREAPYTYGISYFSSKGPTGDGRLKPDLVAPGERIVSCSAGRKLRRALEKVAEDSMKLKKSNVAYYLEDSGTSMAAPHVSGAIAAFLSIRKEFIGRPLEVKKIFLSSATPLGRERYFEGHGLVDLMRAIQSV